MPRKPKPPVYPSRPHRSGQARIHINGADVYLGPFGSPESHAEYERQIGLWRTARVVGDSFAALPSSTEVRTVADLVARFWIHAEAKYRTTDGEPKSELRNFQVALRPLLRLYGPLALRDFGPRKLKDVQKAMATGTWMTADDRARIKNGRKGDGWNRGTVNKAVWRIKSFVGWCESEEMLPPGTAAAFREVPQLAEGEHGVREPDEVPPVPERDLTLTLAQLPVVPRAVIEVLLLTGARPSELLKLRPCDLNRSGEVLVGKGYKVQLGAGVWAFQPKKHKTAYKGHKRVILFGPQAQAVLAPYLERRGADEFVFSPADCMAVIRKAMRAKRKCKVYPSQARKRKARPKRKPGNQYTVKALQYAVRKAAKKADRIDREQGGPGVPHWHVYQCRHNAGTRIVEQFGWDVARTILGHRSFEITKVYALDNLKKAADAQREAG